MTESHEIPESQTKDRGFILTRPETAVGLCLLFIVGLYLYMTSGNQTVEITATKPSKTALGKAAPGKAEEVYTVREETVAILIKGAGTVQASKITGVFSPADGRLTHIPKGAGSAVTTATVIARFDQQALQKKVDKNQAVYDKATAELEQMRKVAVNPEVLRIPQLTVNIAIADLEAARLELAGAEVTAPAPGVLDSLTAVEGQFVPAGQVIAWIVKPTDYMIEGWVSESDAFALHVDATASVRFASRPKETYDARLTKVGETVSSGAIASDAKIPIRLDFKPDQKLDWLRVGMRGARFELSGLKRISPIPRQAVKSEGGLHVVQVRSDNRFVPRRVEIGLFDDTMIEVTDGLRENEVIAVD